MKKRYVTTVVTHNDGSKVVRMHPISKSCCSDMSLIGEILSACVRLVLAVGLCVAGCDLAKSMKATSLLELSKSSEDCKVVFQNLTNDMMLASLELTSTIAGINTRLSSVTNTLSLSIKAVDDLKRKLESNAGK